MQSPPIRLKSIHVRPQGQQQHLFKSNLMSVSSSSLCSPPAPNHVSVPYCCLMCNGDELNDSATWLMVMTELSWPSHFQVMLLLAHSPRRIVFWCQLTPWQDYRLEWNLSMSLNKCIYKAMHSWYRTTFPVLKKIKRFWFVTQLNCAL